MSSLNHTFGIKSDALTVCKRVESYCKCVDVVNQHEAAG